MKEIASFLSIVALVALIGVLAGLPKREFSWLLLSLFVAQLVFAIGPWWALQRIGKGPEYARAFYLLFTPALVLSVAVAGKFALVHGWRGAAISCWAWLGVGYAISHLFVERLRGVHISPESLFAAKWQVVAFSAWLGCAGIALTSLVVNSTAVGAALRLALGLFWLAQAAYGLGYVVARLNPQKVLAWIPRQEWVPGFIAVLAFTWLAISLHGQMEGQRALERESEIEVARMVPAMERRSR